MIFKELSKLNVSDHTEVKGKFTYLSWTWAWSELMKLGKDVSYKILPVEYHQDNSATVHTEMTIDSVTFPMYLPVMDFRNQAIQNPDAMAINKARMRCLVKNIAMFGLGLYIYAGEDLPDVDPQEAYNDLCDQHKDSIQAIKDGIATEDYASASEAWFELSDDVKGGLWKAPTKGGIFTTKEREAMKTAEFRQAYFGVEDAA